MKDLPLKNIWVLEFCQYLSGPCATLRLADLGARVIKIERPNKGEAGRKLAIENQWVGEDSLLFHTINRNKDSFAADLNDPKDREWVDKLIAKADVLIHNFRPGTMEKKGLDYASVKKLNRSIIYASISGYGEEGPWKNKPGQDLLIQSLSGLAYTTGNKQDNPVPFGLGLGDYLCGNQAVQGILAALIRKKRTGQGAKLELSLLESAVDFQFELFTTYFQSKRVPIRSSVNNAHTLLSAPYGIYKTADGYLAVAMMPLQRLNRAIDCVALAGFTEAEAFTKRDEIKCVLTHHFKTNTTAHWLERSQPHDLWMAPVMNWDQLRSTQTYRQLQVEQHVALNGGKTLTTTRCPIRMDGTVVHAAKPAPAVGEQTDVIKAELSRK
ncbi:CaiB/BaiF CoA transferase family protein [Parapedobacter indicus]|uniref:Crotonobetainyl-CoA:carnitine CoA-transferase CaiB n=1 Tax=Parapedobacter indicus TaxID=1477437 RepID=A0A1I3S242_9SPHI|nr:CaiB/BaiF CoA-transferase family protein [Parapedobacter indicus]PPK99925.1 crotonobetainyl-CoA:carnitine CoA-transferase CaiB-like acyl-CoA transferase [Parapedobacter indicus]SFJ51647.1 Crotonobetainyl-CoA:carnitine CoA-transferase CaiB [Parapedobacter indicus]